MTTTPEPKNLGAVVVDSNGKEWVRTEYPQAPWFAPGCAAGRWDQLDNPTVVHEGWVRPVAEPQGWGARIKDANGVRASRPISEEFDEPWLLDGHGWRDWSDFAQPVTVLDPGESS